MTPTDSESSTKPQTPRSFPRMNRTTARTTKPRSKSYTSDCPSKTTVRFPPLKILHPSPISKKKDSDSAFSVILLLRRICPDASMSPIKTDDEWKQYLAPSIRQGYWQIRRSTTYGWPPTVNRKKSRNTGRTRRSKIPAAAAPQSPPSDISETARFFGYYDL